MMIFRLALCIVPIAYVLSSCGTAAVHLYTLSTLRPMPTSNTTVTRAHDLFVVESVRIPLTVDRDELVVRKSANELTILENEHWAAPLREQVRRALVADLQLATRDLAERNLTESDPVSPAPTTGIRVDIRVWDAAAQVVHLNAEWRIRSFGSATPFALRCESDFSEITSGSAGDMVRADQALLNDLAKSIALVLRADHPTRCRPAEATMPAP
jgi:hypothetical protein